MTEHDSEREAFMAACELLTEEYEGTGETWPDERIAMYQAGFDQRYADWKANNDA